MYDGLYISKAYGDDIVHSFQLLFQFLLSFWRYKLLIKMLKKTQMSSDTCTTDDGT
jgi:hypothetical protein